MPATYFSAFSSALNWGLFAPLKLSGSNWDSRWAQLQGTGGGKHPEVHGTAASPTPTKNYLAPNVGDAKVEESCFLAQCSLVQNKKIHPDPLSGGHIVPLN